MARPDSFVPPLRLQLGRDRLGFFAFVAANAASELGNVVAVVALPWFVLVTTGSPARTGITAFATTLPMVFGAIAGGPIVDRLGLRRTSVLSDLGAGVFIATIPLLHALDVLGFWTLVGVALLAATCEAPGRAVRRALVPELAERAQLALERANSIAATSEHTGYVLGAPLAGVLIAALGAPGALWVDAGTFLGSAALVAGAVPDVGGSLGATRVLDGFRHVAKTPVLRAFFLIWTAGTFFIGPIASVVLPVYARTEFGGPGSLAACVTAYGVGGLAGTLAFGAIGLRLPRRAFYVGMWLVYPTLSFLLVAIPRLALLVVLLFAFGLVAGAYNPFEVTIQQELIPPDLRARAFALLVASEMIVLPPAMLLDGVVLDAAGLRAGLLLFAIGNTLLAAYALANRAARRL